ncbi:PAK4-inhibitor INKA2 isoform X1 [Paramormyrops kingsleyae]|uniref:PAK4-inhibitor INKA2 n=1 Tax=Paramormyrops kingsleyae TaxID=1676925 RepID=A0A3B3Q6E3_9TELE|nr:PAK4-inhibitor INKA2 [Paramormyrops kingsleyae]XP_023681372.1 PAK4-inhibitor INKA2 [Paramormyrops kingsleyae]
MEQQHSTPDRKNMDKCLRRLKQELLSMREAGDGLHAQMNSMMGALQELKVLQLQTVLEQLEISGKPSHSPLPNNRMFYSPPLSHPGTPPPKPCQPQVSLSQGRDQPLHRSSPGKMSSASCHQSLPKRLLGESMCSQDNSHCSLPVSQGTVSWSTPELTHAVDYPRNPQTLHQTAQSLESDSNVSSTDDSTDWTSTLMSCGRNRQPLVLGDNVFADLVGNWLDLPELGKRALAEKEEEEEEPAPPLPLSRSQEIYRRFSLTTNVFKKFLRSVRPDKDKLLKEKPGWMPLDNPEAELLKRPKKVNKLKGTFYLPFRSGSSGQQGKNILGRLEGTSQTTGMYTNGRQPEIAGQVQPGFDYSTVVWV